ncbi:MAG TPA: hypothetical protein VFD64_00120 [Gemmatimonadaceae bacterium]|jgi:hypothetical protein|nr:hypothetical protein [Gemmatimonadaceae bacterium]
MSALPSPITPSRWQHGRTIVADLLIATALIWTLPLLLGAVVAIVTFVFGSR